MPNGVSCSVANCSFWGQGNQCNADQIMIDIDSHANNNGDTEFAAEGFGHEHKDKAVNQAETCCHTFKAKE
ncbi:hypothetical protein Back11_26040 [Paenibacillus baekrokdamisoli]|uniref:Uncharacterized protein n=1 Tax=Paenibacillus baekrokdamisoli TaxID=1712516 RepID=A0A3G9JE42_9BACL|nr:DUF1540 domain-containing protein [Paenibacillus baekrokdamisoli]MBB3070254.1 hypothetical protein [Paenibacillus baekrokdamisoli]BBH21259.1 hypothetical protein Back11_26040 [Paenibacillus baekrokdamisoli]